MNDRPSDGRRIGGDDFEEALSNVVMDAVLDGMSVEGAWDLSRDGVEEVPDFTVEIYQVDRTNREND